MYIMENTELVQQGASEASPPACMYYNVDGKVFKHINKIFIVFVGICSW